MNEAEVERGNAQCKYLRRGRAHHTARNPWTLSVRPWSTGRCGSSDVSQLDCSDAPETTALSMTNWERNGSDTWDS